MTRYLIVRCIGLAMIVGAIMPASGAWASFCSNESLRSELRSGQLPDCRAYEIVSPSYTQGTILTSMFAVSPEGSHIIAGSLGAFAGAEQVTLNNTNVVGAAYLLSRTPEGWASTAFGPPSSKYRGATAGVSGGFLDASTDLDTSLWKLGTLEQSEKMLDLYLERPLGTFVKIGPATPESSGPNNFGISAEFSYRGASEDLSHVLFSAVPGFRWPFDGTVGGSTLYEYVGIERPHETREPILVGVEGGWDSTALISHCGTRLGSSSVEEGERGVGSTYNAISASGARIFFTSVGTDEADGGCEGPPVSELFMREELSPTESQTIAVSEPSISYCSPPPPGSPPPCADANFEGASRDGSKILFTSTQKLLEGASEDSESGDSAKECTSTVGSGGCNLYEDELVGSGGSLTQRLVLISGGSSNPQVQGVARVSEDGSHVYFVAKGELTKTANNIGNAAVEGHDNLYDYSEGHISFVATLAPFESKASPGDSADWAHEDERPVAASSEGRFLVFASVADLTNEGVSTGRPQVFQYDAATHELVRASIGQGGYNDDGRNPSGGSTIVNGFPSSYSDTRVDSPTSASEVAPADGAVFFRSRDALTPGALNDVQIGTQFVTHEPIYAQNVYEYHEGHVYLLSDGHDVSIANDTPGTYLAGSDPSGSDVFFFTTDSLVPGDENTQQDLYDARVEGGFPIHTSPVGCAGEVCQGALAETPVLAPLRGSSTQTAEPEISPVVYPAPAAKPKSKPKPAKCKKGFVKKHKKCVKEKARKSDRRGGQ
jgi:hypothetical protein